MTSDELRDERLDQARKHMSAANRVLPAHCQGKGSLYCQLHSRLDGRNAAGPGPQEL